MYGVAGLPVVNSVSLATELILQVCKCQHPTIFIFLNGSVGESTKFFCLDKGERTVDDLRVIVLPFESIMSGVWLVLQIHAYCKFHWYILNYV